ncbi:hypothetical protein EW146_g7536 [Bondarzewia mesenterica]|uniref:Uncharacterized protein n=1 Tax=Bondarzewia mesenterica TaxID=1095465 RepID=A0A4S4LKI9_9AGAM|nr:hypothetical protein EW146_g7536 [Bondarzewia mesenterica]
MVGDTLYKQHLEEAKEAKEISTCSNHWAVNQANADHHNLEATGINATAYARHSCFYLHMVVDFQKGERQMNMNYSLSGALKTLSDIPQTLIMYDIMYQYGVHLHRWFAESQYLMMPEDLEIVKGISVWHIYGHQDQCFFPSICKKYVKAKATFADSEKAFAELTSATDARLLTKWTQQEGVAAASYQTHPEWLDIYDISKTKSKAAYQLQLTEAERKNALGILRGMAAIPDHLSLSIVLLMIATFNQEAIRYIGEIEQAEEWEDILGNEIQDPMSDDKDDADATLGPANNISKNADEEEVAKSVVAKKICLSLPSTFDKDKCMELGLQALAKQELKLWKGQVNDALHHIRIHLSHKSFLFQTSVSIYKDLDPKDLKVRTAISDPSKLKHWKESLAWFWNMDVRQDTEQRGWIEEFYRVYWLQVKALRDRWEEQVTLLTEEMRWSVHRAYAAQQQAIWKRFSIQADGKFGKVKYGGH